MEIKLINRQTECELLMIGRLDAQSAPGVEKIVLEQASRFNTIILNLAKLEYTSSAGLRVIRALQAAMEQKDGEFYVKNVNERVMEVFEMTGFASFLKFIK